MDNNYFSDITELFIKAKQAEKINVSPHSKAAIREMLAHRADEIKAAEGAPTGSFFSKWKFQLMGVPASFFAVFLLVFAFQNLQITMPGATEGSSMERSGAQTEATAEVSGTSEASEVVVEDVPVIKEVDVLQVKPEPLTIDYSEPKTGGTYTPPAVKTGGGPDTPPVYTPPTKTIQPEAAPKVAPYVEPYVAPVKQVKQPAVNNPIPTNEYIMISETLDDVDTTYKPLPLPEVDVQKIEPKAVNKMMNSGIPLPNPDDGVNEFRDPFNPLVPEFDTEALNTIEKTDTLDNVNVHYLNKDQAAVEVVETDSTRWYMFEAIDGQWTVTQKFD